MRQEISELKTTMGGVLTRLDGVETRLAGVETKLDGVDKRLTTLEGTTRNIAIIVAGHTDKFVRIEEQLTKLDRLDDIMNAVERCTTEVIASRNARTLADKGFFDQQATLTDHELRLTRIERREKQS